MSRRCKTIVINIRKLFKMMFFVPAIIIIVLQINAKIKFQDKQISINCENYMKNIFLAITGFDFSDLSTIVYTEIPLMNNVNAYFAITVSNAKNADMINDTLPNEKKQENFGEQHAISEAHVEPNRSGITINGISINNESEFSVDIRKSLDSKLKFNFASKGPKVLIIHTHTTEAYAAPGKTSYSNDENERNTDLKVNVARVGDEIEKVFKDRGINVIHDVTIHDEQSFSGSYKAALATIEKYKKKYPSIDIVLDIHRDSVITTDKKKLKMCATVDGQKVAQSMFVVGTCQNFNHPNWRDNLDFAIKLQNKIITKYPELMRPINIRKERFNQHVTRGSLIMEVGSSGNTLEEAMLGAKYAAKAMSEFISDTFGN